MKANRNKWIITIIFLLIIFFLVLIILGNKNIDIKKISNINIRFDSISSLMEVKKQNKKLRNTNMDYTKKSEESKLLREENEVLKAMHQFKEQNPEHEFIACNIYKKDMNKLTTTYIVNKGSNAGLSKNMIVVTPQGLFGKISLVRENYSIVESIEDSNVAVGAIIQENKNSVGIVRGIGNDGEQNILKMTVSNTASDIKSGDIVTTYSLGNLVPSGIKIGYVSDQQVNIANLSKSVTIKPCLNFNSINMVLVIVPKDKENGKYTGGVIKY